MHHCPCRTPVETIETPGAATSGPRALSPERGPLELKEAYRRNPGFWSAAAATVAVSPAVAAAASAGPEDCWTPRNGMVTVYGVPSSGLEVIWPSKGG